MILLLTWPFTSSKISPNASFSNLITTYQCHDGPIIHMSYMEQQGVLITYGSDGKMSILDIMKQGAE